MSTRDWLMVLAVGCIWGTSFLFIAILLREFDPFWIAAGRLGIAALVSWGFLVALGKAVPKDPMLYLQLGGFGVLAYGLPFMLFPLAQQHVSSGMAAILNGMTPLMTVVIAHFWPGGERARPAKMLGVLFGLGGATLLALPAIQAGGGSQLWAMMLCLGAVLLYAITLNMARAFRAIDPTVVATLALTGSAVLAVPVALIAAGLPTGASAGGWAAMVALAVFPTAVAFQIMYRVLPRVGASNFSVNTFVSPVVALLLGIIILHEAFLPTHLLGMLGIFAGLLLMDGRVLRAFGWGKGPARVADPAAQDRTVTPGQ